MEVELYDITTSNKRYTAFSLNGKTGVRVKIKLRITSMIDLGTLTFDFQNENSFCYLMIEHVLNLSVRKKSEFMRNFGRNSVSNLSDFGSIHLG